MAVCLRVRKKESALYAYTDALFQKHLGIWSSFG